MDAWCLRHHSPLREESKRRACGAVDTDVRCVFGIDVRKQVGACAVRVMLLYAVCLTSMCGAWSNLRSPREWVPCSETLH